MYYLLITIFCIFSLSAVAQKKLNPDISLNTLFTYSQSSSGSADGAEKPNGFALQEAELRVTSNIDSYFRGDVILAVEKEEPDNPGDEAEFIVEPEEVFIDTLSLPGVTVRVGKFYPYWGRSNQWHTHSFPFIDALQTREAVFGDEGFNEVGAAISYLLPTPWYFELVAQGFSAKNEKVFSSAGNDDITGVLFIKNLWDLTDQSTLELDLSLAIGDDINNEQNNIYNMALTYKNKFNDQQSFLLTTEYTQTDKSFEEAFNQGMVLASSHWVQYQWAKRWWLQAKYERVSGEEEAYEGLEKSSALIGFVPSEYSSIRLQYDHVDYSLGKPSEDIVLLQLNLTLGAHPAHSY